MKRLYVITMLAVLVSLSLGLTAANCSDVDDKTTIAKKFLDVYLRGDYVAMRNYVPPEFEDLTGPFPFKQMPTLGQAKVDRNQALVDFTASPLDSKYIGKGGILCFKHDGVWHVRQVMYYNKIPSVFNLPTASKTADDKRQEPTVKALAEKFVCAWHLSDYTAMRALWFDWPNSVREPVEHLRISNINITLDATPWKDTFVTFSAKVSYKPVGWLPAVFMTAHGNFLMIKVNGEWRVRANQIQLRF